MSKELKSEPGKPRVIKSVQVEFEEEGVAMDASLCFDDGKEIQETLRQIGLYDMIDQLKEYHYPKEERE